MNRSDRKIALGAMVAAVLALVGTWLMGSDEPVADKTGSVLVKGSRSSRPVQYYAVESSKAERFPFDPNSADSTQLLRLGLQPWQVRNIYKYRAKGGVYRSKEDFARLYGLTVKQYR